MVEALMKISKIIEMPLSEVNKMKRFDLQKPVRKQARILQPIAWLIAIPETIKRKLKITKIGMEPLKKEPYLLLCNHNSFYDFKVAMRAVVPRRATYVVAVDGFIDREGLMRMVGCFGKRKFINDITVVKQIKRSIHELKHICMVYPEARYSHVGTTAILPESLGKLVKLLKTPVATLITHGNHLIQPAWDLRKRKVAPTATMTYLLTIEEIEQLSAQEINARLVEAFRYDDYAWQKANKIVIGEKWRAEGLEAVLYQCPNCKKEGQMSTKDSFITCNNCHKSWQMDEYGVLKATTGETEFSHIPDWYEWQRQQVKEEVEKGTYHFEHEVNVNLLPNSTGFYQIGTGKLVHNLEGLKVAGSGFNESFEFIKEPLENYGIHVEYFYFERGHGISFSTLNDSYYFFSKEPSYLVTKVHFAVEEIYKIKRKHQKEINNFTNI